MRRSTTPLAVAGVVLGLLAESAAFDLNDPARWIPDLVTGWSLIACGLFVRIREPRNPTGALLAATGFTWFLGNWASAGGVAGWIGGQCIYLHRGPLFHSIIGYPTGRTPSALAKAAIGVSYAVAILPAVWDNEPMTIALAAALVAVTAAGYARSIGLDRRARLIAVEAAVGMSAVIVAGAVARLVAPGPDVGTVVLLAYEAMVVAVAAGLTARLVSARWGRAAVTDLVVELGEARSGNLRAELARALGDPSLEVGYWQPDSRVFVDAEGEALTLPTHGSDRASTVVEGEHEPVAVLVHDPAVLGDPALLEAVTAATRLTVSNARLRAEVQARVSQLEASRRRLLDAGDEQRRALEHRLQEGAERRLRDIGDVLRSSRAASDGGATEERIAAAEAQLDETLEDLRRLARGLHPRILSDLGLDGALAALLESFPIPVEVQVPSRRLGGHAELVAYFVCSEALTNVAKHASASRAAVSVTTSDRAIMVVVEDDGVGGADPAAGSGLRGLADRIETLGGILRVESAPGSGTRLAAEVPLGGEPSSSGTTISRSSSRSSSS
ncbi:MAG TPA: ATP-binding protein [Actinomycetota bacterium]|nr:ATP-binding protein [Actinomycetota bacterium]